MERIFGARPPARPRARMRGLRSARTGVVSVATAGVMAVAAAILILIPGRPPPPQPAPQPAPRPVAHPVPAPVPGSPVAATPSRVVQPVPPARRRIAPRRAAQRPSPTPAAAPVTAPAAGAPHLTGEALRRALAEDVILTRQLNRAALARSVPPDD